MNKEQIEQLIVNQSMKNVLLKMRVKELENNWNKLKKWLLCMEEVSHLDLKCLKAILDKMQELEDGGNNE